MPRQTRSSVLSQPTIDFPRRKTRSQGKTGGLKTEALGTCSPRKRSETSKAPSVSPKKKKNNKGKSVEIKEVSENTPPTSKQDKTDHETTKTPNQATVRTPNQVTIRTPNQATIRTPQGAAMRTPAQSKCILSLGRAEGQCYSAVKKALHTGAPDNILCRDTEIKAVTKFLEKHVQKKKPGSLYISGAPGTGKTACLTMVIRDMKEVSDCPVTFINCMSLQHSHAIFAKIIEELGIEEKVATKDAQKVLERKFTAPGPMRILILDEMDQLETKNRDVLYTMFEWPSLPKSKLVLIGIANALDLTDRILPRLQARPKCKPELLNFPPYTRNQISTILQQRISQTEGETPVLDTPAIQFCARKVAAVAGDIRKALDICRRAVEVVESDVRKQHILQPTKYENAQTKGELSSPTPTAKKVSLGHIASVVSDVYGSRIMANSSGSQPTIPLQQKLLVCTLLLMLKQGKVKEVILGKLHETYSNVCKKRQVNQVTQDDFIALCKLLETRGIITLKKAKEMRMIKVSLKIDENEVDFALQDKTLLSAILQDAGR
ncbi:cell division control protein 6 homolog isoform X3 [Nematostella vectensis]|uniref:cell division control protein 6 homolog isoform X2 n=1 Tax=Nematostella vectensis TaxID=45351 RepID=UPI0020777E5C|nr:cell division control protein 6 homolog isoform X2 [Nematostella vectensis]XP_048579628.1 cell division control protein 6 homolog isoform X3 [Nematostella vectensis]